MTEDEAVGWHHELNAHESEPTLGDSKGQGDLLCCSPWDLEDSDLTEQLNYHLDRDSGSFWVYREFYFLKPTLPALFASAPKQLVISYPTENSSHIATDLEYACIFSSVVEIKLPEGNLH